MAPKLDGPSHRETDLMIRPMNRRTSVTSKVRFRRPLPTSHRHQVGGEYIRVIDQTITIFGVGRL